MKKRMKSVFCALLSLLMLVCMAVPAFAADASVQYEGDAKKFIFAPGSDESPTDLFDNFKGVMPGDTLTQKITVKNDASNQVKVKIYLRSLGAQEGDEAFLSQMNLTVTQEGDSELFAAPADQTDGLNDWVCLGTFYSGADVDLNVQLDVPITMGDEFQNAIGKIDWQFKVEELPIESTDPTPPQTGEDFNVWMYAVICSVSVVLMIGLFFAVRRKKRAN